MKGEMSALAVGEKRRRKSGGCIGVLFQLFKWKCLVKKKELLSPGRSKRISKRFGGPEISPMAKRLLFADENSGGSPNREKLSLVDVEQNDGMQTPGVVARLMGLESMPVVCHDKPKKASGQGNKSANHLSSSEEHSKIFSGGSCGYNLEKGSARANLSPQKLQKKAGVSDRQPVNKSGAGALQLKKALSCSKNQPRKLVSPVKTTRVLSGRNASRLMEAATKILEPGLKETNRTRRSLAFSSSSNESLKYQTRIEGMAVKQSAQPSYPFTAKSLKGQPPFNSCGDSKVRDCRPNNGVQVPVSGSSAPVCNNDSSYWLGKSNMKVSSLEKERNAKTQRPVSIINQDGGMSQAAQARVNLLRSTQNSTDRKPHLKHHDVSTSNWQSRTLSSLKHNNLKQNMMLLARDEVLPRQELCNQQSRSCSPADGDKENNALNRNMNTRSMRTRMPVKVSGYSKIGMERNASDRKDESSSKLRTFTQNEGPVSCPHIDDICLPAIAAVNQIIVRNNANDAKENWKAHGSSSSKDADIVSFTFSYPMRLCAKTFSTVELTEKQKGHCDLSCNASPCKKVISDARNGIALPQRMVDSIGGARSTVIEQRIREISRLEADDFAKADSLPRNSNASILEEVSAVVAGRLFSQVNRDGSLVNFGSKDSLHRLDANHDSKKCRKFNTTTKSQADARPQAFTMCLLPTDYDRCSPTSILEASFSSDSCLCASLDGNLGYNPPMESTHHLGLPMHPDADLTDSIVSMSKGMTGRRYLADFIISSCKMHRIDPAEIGNSGNKFNYVWEVLSNMELLFGNDVPYDVGGMGGSLVGSLLNKLETLADSPWQQPRRNLGIAESMERNQLRGWLFDCVLEFLDSKYSHYCKSGFRTWENFPVSLGIEKWTREVYNEIRRWSGLPGRTVDEMVEREFSSSLGKWTNFDIETYETGTLVEEDIFQILLDELAMDLGGWRAASV